MGNVRTVYAIPRRWPTAEMATRAGRALVAAESPNTFLNSDAAIVILEFVNSSFGTAAN
jgi:hypothetical protein